jgi:iron complex outermembrane receptor protein
MKKPHVVLILLALLMPVALLSQVVVTGCVTDAQTAEPLAGANIQILSSGKGIATNSQGQFTLTLTEPKTVIRISYLGYLTETQVIMQKSSTRRIEIALTPATINTDAVVVTATRNMKRVKEIPGRTEWLSAKQMDAIPAVQADDYLRVVPGIQISREHGILDHSTTVSMRGLGGDQQGRYLVLLDGIPLNKADGGSVNWNSMNPEEMGQIEVAKGPVSSLYGGNAMGGVINYIRKKPATSFEGSAQLEYGSMNTQRGRFNIGGNPNILNKGLYWGIQGFGARSDGYIQTPEEEIDSTTIASYMKEFGGSARVGYKINDNHQIEVNSGYWWDRRGNGTKIFAETGTYYAHGTLDNSIRYTGNAGKANWSAVAYSKNENYSRLNESIKASGDSYDYTSYSVT